MSFFDEEIGLTVGIIDSLQARVEDIMAELEEYSGDFAHPDGPSQEVYEAAGDLMKDLDEAISELEEYKAYYTHITVEIEKDELLAEKGAPALMEGVL